jgi:hypothetical protein
MRIARIAGITEALVVQWVAMRFSAFGDSLRIAEIRKVFDDGLEAHLIPSNR